MSGQGAGHSALTLDQRFAEAMGQLLGPDFPSDIALAVSGGGDSMAMLTLAHNWARVWGLKLWVVTIDHGLRPESADEAAMVAAECAVLGHPHATLRWRWDGKGNLQDAARRARLELIGRWRGRIGHVLFAHTMDDVAETFLARLSRSAGVAGLSEMQAKRAVRSSGDPKPLGPEEIDGARPPRGDHDGGFRVIRPCLDMTRAELRHYLTTLKGQWVEDPSNEDPKYDRVRMRRLLPTLHEHGLGAATLANAARRMARAAEALRGRAAQVWEGIGTEGRGADGAPTGELIFARDGFEATERETQMRLLSSALCYVSGHVYRPREAPLEGLLNCLLGGGGGTLHGCEARMERDALRVFREYAAVQDLCVPLKSGAVWDGRWRVFAPDFKGLKSTGLKTTGLSLRPLGEDGWAQARGAGDNTPPFHAARALPSLWDGARLLACDAMGVGPGHTTRLAPMGDATMSFAAFVLSH